MNETIIWHLGVIQVNSLFSGPAPLGLTFIPQVPEPSFQNENKLVSCLHLYSEGISFQGETQQVKD